MDINKFAGSLDSEKKAKLDALSRTDAAKPSRTCFPKRS